MPPAAHLGQTVTPQKGPQLTARDDEIRQLSYQPLRHSTNAKKNSGNAVNEVPPDDAQHPVPAQAPAEPGAAKNEKADAKQPQKLAKQKKKQLIIKTESQRNDE